jgi:hypothetical protein
MTPSLAGLGSRIAVNPLDVDVDWLFRGMRSSGVGSLEGSGSGLSPFLATAGFLFQRGRS